MQSSHFSPTVLNPDPQRRERILAVLDAALAAVDPAQAIRRFCKLEEEMLVIGDAEYDLLTFKRIFVIGFGKAATPMAAALRELLGDRITAGRILTKYGHGPVSPEALGPIEVMEAGHPMPDEAGVAAAEKIAELAREAGASDLVICLISGGGSALLTLPAPGLSLADMQAFTDALLRCGATINEINTLRKHFSQVKGGQLARLVAPATLFSLVVSDVVASPLDVIASGPTVPDSTTWQDAWDIVVRYQLQDSLPQAVRERLQQGVAGAVVDTPKPGDPAFRKAQTLIIADNALAAQAAASQAREAGFETQILTTFLEGEAREVAKMLVALGREIVSHARPLKPPACLILGGETTVTLRGEGKGGRNQELALAAALVLDQIPESEPMVIAALATDGTDGPTDAAGGIADATTVARGRTIGLDAAAHLARNDAYPYLQAVEDLLVTGPTQTNVNDLVLVFVFP